MTRDTLAKIGMRPTHPGAFVREEIIDELGLSISAAAEALGVRRATLSDFINEKAGLSAEMALRLEKAFGVGMDMLLHMQALHDAHRMRAMSGTVDVQPYRPAKRA